MNIHIYIYIWCTFIQLFYVQLNPGSLFHIPINWINQATTAATTGTAWVFVWVIMRCELDRAIALTHTYTSRRCRVIRLILIAPSNNKFTLTYEHLNAFLLFIVFNSNHLYMRAILLFTSECNSLATLCSSPKQLIAGELISLCGHPHELYITFVFKPTLNKYSLINKFNSAICLLNTVQF